MDMYQMSTVVVTLSFNAKMDLADFGVKSKDIYIGTPRNGPVKGDLSFVGT